MLLNIIVVTLFPEMIEDALKTGVIQRAFKSDKVILNCLNYRDFADDKHKTVDDRPYGGGPGMLLKPDICLMALEKAKELAKGPVTVIALTPAGKPLNQGYIQQLASCDSQVPQKSKTLVIFSGRYEGFDQRFLDSHVDCLLSLGDFVLSGGELPALCLIDAICRLIPGTIKDDSVKLESFEEERLDYPQYTKPFNFNGDEVPSVLLSGNHVKIKNWRKQEALQLTLKIRPDLLKPSKEIE